MFCINQRLNPPCFSLYMNICELSVLPATYSRNSYTPLLHIHNFFTLVSHTYLLLSSTFDAVDLTRYHTRLHRTWCTRYMARNRKREHNYANTQIFVQLVLGHENKRCDESLYKSLEKCVTHAWLFHERKSIHWIFIQNWFLYFTDMSN